MAEKKIAIVTVDEVTYRHYKVLTVYFISAKKTHGGSAFHNYGPQVMLGSEVFEYVEKLAKNNGYILERNTDFGVNVPRILLQHANNPGYFSVPYSL
jgi:hypothetical protein